MSHPAFSSSARLIRLSGGFGISTKHHPGVARDGVTRNDLGSYLNMEHLELRREGAKLDYLGEVTASRPGAPKPTPG